MRYERKYRIMDLGHLEVLEQVRQHPRSFRTAFPDRQVNNIYLDTPGLGGFEENLMGLSQRAKTRIRWYGTDLFVAQKPVLECKYKDAGLGGKLNLKLPDFTWRSPMQMNAVVQQGLAHARQEVARLAAEATDGSTFYIPLSSLRPSLLNTYQRSYFVSQDGRFRLTIDRELRFYHPGFMPRPGLNHRTDPAVIVELKYEQEDDTEFEEVAASWPFPLARNSKYTTGVLLVQD